jgi:hypothetical protein
MSIYSYFFTPTYYAFQGKVDNPTYSNLISDMQGADPVRYNILYKKTDSILLDSGGTRTITLPESTFTLSEWSLVTMKVIGTARLTTTGKNYDGSSDITGIMDTFGTDLYPGYIVLSTYNVSAFTISSQADGTIIELLYGVSCADTDIRYV